ncbi:MAG: hypothetical protein MAG795_00722 [Candidatus Woesearchaeota archaeon]|nr:hypothetical protein [Candidatus Woesearchaeota archaeon]
MKLKKLVDWIKWEESQGYSDKQLKKYLLEKGYPKDYVRKAMKKSDSGLIHFSLLKFIKSLSLPVMFAFLISFLFISYSFNQLTNGIIVLILSLLCVVIFDILNRHHRSLVLIWSIISFMILIWVQFKLVFLLFVPFFLIALIPVAFYYFKSNKSYLFESVYLVFFISVVLTEMVILLILLFFSYVIVPLISPYTLITLILISIPVFLLLAFSYLFISTKLLKRVFGKLDYNAYFRFKHFPFRILNIFSSKKPNVHKSINISTFGLGLILFVAAVVALAIFGMYYAQELSRLSENNGDYLYLHRYDYILQQKGYVKFDKYTVQSYSVSGMLPEFSNDKLGSIYGNCNVNLECQKIEFNKNLPLYSQLPKKKEGNIIVAFSYIENNTKIDLFILPQLTKEEILSRDMIETPDLRNLLVVKELNNLHKEGLKGFMVYEQEAKLFRNLNAYDKIVYFFTGELEQNIIAIARKAQKNTIKTRFAHTNTDIALLEHRAIIFNQNNNSIFYDGHSNLKDHKKQLELNIKLLSEIDASLKTDDKRYSGFFTDYRKGDSLNEKMQNRILRGLKRVQLWEEFSSNSWWNANEEKISNDFFKFNNNENRISRTLRLKCYELYLAEKIGRKARDLKPTEAKRVSKQIVKITRYPHYCRDESCRLKYSNFTKKYCTYIGDEEKELECYRK